MKTICAFFTILVLATPTVLGLGADYGPGQPVGGASGWPKGMSELANATNRVHGFFVNAQDIFFYSGAANDLAAFFKNYSQIQGIEKHRLVLHAGVGEAKSPWDKIGRPCDWELMGCPRSWMTESDANLPDLKNTNYVLEMHFWLGGKISLNDVSIPKNIELTGDCFKNFESITNGMTRAEVERQLTVDGGLQGVSSVRFTDTNCPGFKINVEFEYKTNSADHGRAIQSSDDKVIGVSRPYLERPFMD